MHAPYFLNLNQLHTYASRPFSLECDRDRGPGKHVGQIVGTICNLESHYLQEYVFMHSGQLTNTQPFGFI